ncbi:MAG TPA: glucose 1-dehydrogenase [Xanthobacteraceae bacterium]|nr:glucose 1-dehydrogenase [Xanthobacteraceae bacterium]
MRLKDKAAIVTGAGSGIGQCIAETFAREGARVCVLDVDAGAAHAVADEIGTSALALGCDVTRAAEIDAAVRSTLAAFGRLDILVNNAGTAHVNKPVTEISEEELDRVIAVNVKGLFLFSQAMVPVMRAGGGGAIINIGSTAGLRPRPGLSAYNATKGAVHTLTQTLAVELAPDKIRVCAIAPVATETPLLPTFLGPAPGMRQKFEATVPLGRLARPQDIANAALFLASDDAAFVTGNIVEVDGGRCV